MICLCKEKDSPSTNYLFSEITSSGIPFRNHSGNHEFFHPHILNWGEGGIYMQTTSLVGIHRERTSFPQFILYSQSCARFLKGGGKEMKVQRHWPIRSSAGRLYQGYLKELAGTHYECCLSLVNIAWFLKGRVGDIMHWPIKLLHSHIPQGYSMEVTGNHPWYCLPIGHWVKLCNFLLQSDFSLTFGGHLWINSFNTLWVIPNKILQSNFYFYLLFFMNNVFKSMCFSKTSFYLLEFMY